MYEVKENDLKLSKKYLELQTKLDKKRSELIEKDKKVNDQTIEACLLFQSNKEHYKSLVKDLKYFDKKDSLIRSISRDFPECDIKLLAKEIDKVIISEKSYCYFMCLMFAIVFFIGTLVFNFIISFKIVHIFQYYFPLFCILILIFIFIDSYIRD